MSKLFIAVLILGLLVSCGGKKSAELTKDHEGQPPEMVYVFDGYYFLPVNGFIELYTDWEGRINIRSSNLVFENSDDTFAGVGVVATKMARVGQTASTEHVNLSATIARQFVSNEESSPILDQYLPSSGWTYRYWLVLKREDRLFISYLIQGKPTSNVSWNSLVFHEITNL